MTASIATETLVSDLRPLIAGAGKDAILNVEA
jgi:hypothetical protein